MAGAMIASGWGLSIALIAFGFTILAAWAWIERQNRERARPRDISRLIAEIRRHDIDG